MGPLPEGKSVLDAMINMQGTGRLSMPYIVLPIGISFFTFQAMSYVIDVYRNDAKLQTNIFDLALYVSLFPQLIAGPIVRYNDVALELEDRVESIELMISGIKRFCYGMGKKVLLSNTFAVIADSIWSVEDTTTLGTAVAWYGIAAYTLQIYYDFSGYSDMAIGLGRMIGFEFCENFNYPYVAESITDFWRRWHISLSTWFRDYVYIPLGGNRCKPARHIINIFTVWFLTGMWHGAGWNFILWGLYYGVLLCLEKVVLGKLLDKIPAWIRHISTFILVMFGWLLFASDGMDFFWVYFRSMFTGPITSSVVVYDLIRSILLIAVLFVAATPLPSNIFRKVYEKKWGRWAIAVGAFAIMIISVAYMIASSYNPFLYFRF
jgi:alginate O-acetyltransferase complex protein AlgI